MNIAIAIAALLISAFVGYGFFKAGSFKVKSSEAVLLSAGFGWVEKAGMPLVRVIAWLELLGAVGVILAPLAAIFLPGFEWALTWGIAASAGLALTMVVAFIMHAVRGEAKYTWKSNLQLFAAAAAAGLLQAVISLPVF